MGQEKIDWTLDMISQLKQEGVGDVKKLEGIQNQLENNSEVSDKDIKYLKKHFDILEKRDQKERAKICARCEKKLGFMKYTPKYYSGYEEKVCSDCDSHITKNHNREDGKYIEGTLDLKPDSSIELHFNNFDQGSIVITSKKDLFSFPIEKLKSYQVLELEKDSRLKKVMTVGLKDKTKSEILEMKFHDSKIEEQRIMLKMKNLEKTMEIIFDLRKLCEERGYEEKIPEESQSEEKIEEKLDENIVQKFGKVIKETPGGLYYGGHKAYLAGGTFGDSQTGRLILTEKYLIFIKNAMRESKRWKIVIPLEKVVIGDWEIDEKTRRKSMVGGGVAFGLFGGGGTIHDTGKSHDIVVPYVDENGIGQAPRFGVASLSGNAIREWAKLIYDVLVKIQSEKKPEKEHLETESKDDDLLKVLKLRFVKGEITKEEFEDMKSVLE